MLQDPADCRWCHPWASGPGWYKQAGQSMVNKLIDNTSPQAVFQFLPPGSAFSPYFDFPYAGLSLRHTR